MWFRELVRYLWPKRRFYLNHGGRLINPYELARASDEQKVLILAGIARSPDDAQRLLDQYHTASARDVLRHVARFRKPPTAFDRLIFLIRRIDGHDPRDAYGKPFTDEQRIRVRYRYRESSDE